MGWVELHRISCWVSYEISSSCSTQSYDSRKRQMRASSISDRGSTYNFVITFLKCILPIIYIGTQRIRGSYWCERLGGSSGCSCRYSIRSFWSRVRVRNGERVQGDVRGSSSFKHEQDVQESWWSEGNAKTLSWEQENGVVRRGSIERRVSRSSKVR